MSTTVTLDAIHQRLVPELYGHPLFPPVATTTGAGSSTSLVIAAAINASSSANAFDGKWIYCPSVTTGIKCSRVATAGFAASTGTFTMSQTYGSTPGSGVSAYLLGQWHMNEIDQCLNNVIRNLCLPRWLPLSLVTDGDMEASGVTNWTDIGTPTVTKDTTAAYTAFRQNMKIVTTVLGDGKTSANVEVADTEQVLLSVGISVPTGSATVQLRDASHSNTVLHSVTVDEPNLTDVFFTWGGLPDACELLNIAIISATASTTAYVAWAVLLSTNREIITLPSTIDDASLVEGVFYMPQGFVSDVNESYVGFQRRLEPWPAYDSIRDFYGANSQRIQIQTPRYPLLVQFRDPDAILSQNTSDTATTVGPVELLVEGTLAELKRKQADGLTGLMQAEVLKAANRHQRRYDDTLDSLQLLRPTVKAPITRVRVP